jgi:hypothetical protein
MDVLLLLWKERAADSTVPGRKKFQAELLQARDLQ